MQLELGKSYKLTVKNDGIQIEEIEPSKAKDFKYLRLNRAIFGTDYHPAEVAFKPKPEPEYYNGKVVCVDNEPNKHIYTIGKVYTIKDGVFISDRGSNPFCRSLKSFDDLCSNTTSKFIEYKGENA